MFFDVFVFVIVADVVIVVVSGDVFVAVDVFDVVVIIVKLKTNFRGM